jgi:hypothetical protein
MPNELTVDSGAQNRLDAFPDIPGTSSELLVNK